MCSCSSGGLKCQRANFLGKRKLVWARVQVVVGERERLQPVERETKTKYKRKTDSSREGGVLKRNERLNLFAAGRGVFFLMRLCATQRLLLGEDSDLSDIGVICRAAW